MMTGVQASAPRVVVEVDVPPDAIEDGSGQAGPEGQAQADPAAESSAAGGGDAQPAARQPLSRPGHSHRIRDVGAFLRNVLAGVGAALAGCGVLSQGLAAAKDARLWLF